ncbi:MAG: hypothetical protein J6Q50_02470 [Clostridia bacterium]|nr:hypothetical protein [Clostridia bacterium]
MRILILSSTPWTKDNSFGNSFSNIFEGIEDIEIANIYCKYGKPETDLVSKFFQITEKSMIRNLKNPKVPSGQEVFIEKTENTDIVEPKSADLARKKRWTVMFWARDLIWQIGRWKSPELKKFIDDFKPDIIFQPIYYVRHMNRIAHFIKNYANVPMYGYVSDDVYTLKQFIISPLGWINRFLCRAKVKKVVKQCEILYTISEIQRSEYEKIFKIPCKILTKSANFDEPAQVKSEYNKPLQFLFTGNIGTNRWKSLAIIAEALKEINADGVKAEMKIYTGTPMTDEMSKALNIENASKVMGFVSSSEIPRIQSEADVLIHVESSDLKSKLAVRQSFSTKIVDYLKMARPILAVGPKDVASIAHLVSNDCAIVADNKEELKEKLLEYINDDGKMTELALKGYECGRKFHNKETANKMLCEDILKR